MRSSTLLKQLQGTCQQRAIKPALGQHLLLQLRLLHSFPSRGLLAPPHEGFLPVERSTPRAGGASIPPPTLRVLRVPIYVNNGP